MMLATPSKATRNPNPHAWASVMLRENVLSVCAHAHMLPVGREQEDAVIASACRSQPGNERVLQLALLVTFCSSSPAREWLNVATQLSHFSKVVGECGKLLTLPVLAMQYVCVYVEWGGGGG